MSNSKMLIDAAHPEETRVVVLKGNRVEEFDFESASKKQLRGNIYLAKVTRVEPSLQAAFIEYGGNRHGFLAFSEIHPDYYQIPFADRQALLEEEARAHRDEDDESRESRGGENRNRDGRRGGENRNGGGESRGNGDNGERQARGDARGDRNDRGGRGERGQRRSRRHRRDHAPATALDRRGPADESISEVAFTAGEEAGLAERDEIAGFGERPGRIEQEAVEVVAEREVAEASADQALSDTIGPAASAEAADPVPPVDDDSAPASVLPMAAASGGMAPDGQDVDEPTAGASVDGPTPGGTVAAPSNEVVAAAWDRHVTEASADQADEAAPAGSGDAMARPDERALDDDVLEPVEGRDTQGDNQDGHLPGEHNDDEAHEDEHVEQIGGDALSDVAPRPLRLRRHYKIQEVIKRRQILLIQVVKEERGNKGAALTTYLSLAGRYSVLMPNTAKGGGISRKITDGDDRKRLKAIAQELDVPEGMGVILRTAGAARSPVEVRRDFEYLLRMWESVRELTLKSSAPTLVYEEGSLIKRSIRDLYSKEVEEIVVSGEAGFTEARDFMRMLMPGNVKSVQHYSDPQPIFAKSGVEAQLDAMFSPHVTLKSGGYLVINQTEALVAIDVNSGRSTREHNIEDTALRTNLEAADEVARQLRLRDLAGLIVVDFIDMEEGRNNRAVERRIKEALKNDRARIQIGHISHFGLLEMSRQRIRTGVLEGSTVVCPHCAGAGTVRSTASVALHVLRLVEDALLRDASHDLILRSRTEVALYVLNQKRAKLVELEQRFGVTVTVTADPALTGMIYHAIERGELATPAIAPAPRQDLIRVDSIAPIFEPGSDIGDEDVEIAETSDDSDAEAGADESIDGVSAETGDGEVRRRKRRRRRRGRDREGANGIAPDAAQPSDEGLDMMAEIGGDLVGQPPSADEVGSTPEEAPGFAVEAPAVVSPVAGEPEAPTALVPEQAGEPAVEAPKRRRSRRSAPVVETEASATVEVAAAVDEEAPARPRRRRPSRSRAAEGRVEAGDTSLAGEVAATARTEPVDSGPSADRGIGTGTVEHQAPVDESEAPALAVAAESVVDTPDAMAEARSEPVPVVPERERPKRSGWWQRAKSSFGA